MLLLVSVLVFSLIPASIFIVFQLSSYVHNKLAIDRNYLRDNPAKFPPDPIWNVWALSLIHTGVDGDILSPLRATIIVASVDET